MNSVISIAIDGPAGAGKSTVSSLLASALNYQQIDTGAMYRAITWLHIEKDLDLSRIQDIAFDYQVEYANTPKFSLNGRDITEAIRSESVTAAVSQVSANSAVRQFAVHLQRQMVKQLLSKGIGVVLEGRDIGSVVLPDAKLKVFLTASVETRAERRAKELSRPVADLISEISARDHADSTRADSPLVMATDAVFMDTSGMSQEMVVAKLLELAREAGA